MYINWDVYVMFEEEAEPVGSLPGLP